MKQRRLTFAVAAVLAGSPMLVTAGPVVLPNAEGTTASTVSVWAKELKRDDTAVALVNGINDNMELEAAVGFGFPAGGVERFIRIELTGAKFKGKPTCSVAVDTNPTAAAGYLSHTASAGLFPIPSLDGGDPDGTPVVPPAVVGHGGAEAVACTSRTGGVTGSAFATFKLVSSKSAAVPSLGSLRFVFADADGLIPSGVEEIKVTYSLHNNDVSADASNQALATGILDKKTGTLVSFKPLISIEAVPQLPITADVGQGFLQFVTDTVASAGHGPIGLFKYAPPSNVLTVNDIANPTDSKVAEIADAISASTLTVTGDFTSTQDFTGTTALGTYSTATTRVYLDTTGAGAPAKPCDTVSVAATAVTATAATFNLGTAATGASTYICIKPNGIVPMSPSGYSMAIAFTPKTGYLVEGYSFDNIGEIRQNGTVLDTPYLTTNTNYISRVIFTNTSNKAAEYVASVITDDGATATPGAGATGSIPAGANLQINATNLVAFSAKPRGAVRFVITAPNTAIQAVYQTVNLATGDVQSVLLNRRGGGDGR